MSVHEAVADDERAGRGEHRGDAAEIGGSAHEIGTLGRALTGEQL